MSKLKSDVQVWKCAKVWMRKIEGAWELAVKEREGGERNETWMS